jgi:hypothetical protein
MNTADIRDIEATQSLYWTVAIPVTVAVLAVAFIYGYKGDEIGDWIHDRIRLWKAARFSRPAGLAETRQLLIPTADGSRVKWAGADARAREVWRSARSSVRR